jgi:hypothetical protein
MPVTPLGRETLLAALAGYGRVVIANRTSAGSGLRVMAAAIARHDVAGASRCESVFGLDLGPDEAETFDAVPALTSPVAAVEAMLRLSVAGRGDVDDVYVASPPDAPGPVRGWEIGVRDRGDAAPLDGESVSARFPQVVVYLHPQR